MQVHAIPAERSHPAPEPVSTYRVAFRMALTLSLLYVDDDDALRDLFQRFFERSGEFRVDTAPSGAEALVRLATARYDVVISDYQMPGMTGIELLRRLRAEQNKIPFIIYTHQGMADIAIEAINSGVDFFVLKDVNFPSQLADLAQKCRQAVRLRRAERSLAGAERQARIGNWILEIDSGVFEWSEEMFRLFDVPPEEEPPALEGVLERFDQEDQAAFEPVRAAVLHGQEATWIGRIRVADGTERFLRTIMAPRLDHDGTIRAVFGTTQDITELKIAEDWALQYADDLVRRNQELDRLHEELQEANLMLDRKVQERTREVDRLLRQKDEFIVQLGHDLRTPLTPIMGLLPFIRRRETDPDLAALLEVLIDDAAQLKGLVDKVLSLARLDRMAPTGGSDPIRLREMIDRSITMHRYLIEQSGVEVQNRVPDDLRCISDRELLGSIVDNLFTNALKYSPAGGTVRFTARPTADGLAIAVSDTGAGLAACDLERVFDEFYTVDPSRTRSDSHGLGLSIVRRLTERLGGTVRAESPGPGQGSTFHVTLPGPADTAPGGPA